MGRFVVSFVRFFPIEATNFVGWRWREREKKNRRDDGCGIPSEYSFSARRFGFQRSFVTVALISRKYATSGMHEWRRVA